MIQFVERPGVVDLAYGHPGPELLPVEGWARAVEAALGRHGWRALAYGRAAGPGPLVDWVGARLGVTDAAAVPPDEVLVTAGASAALHLVGSLLARPGDTVLVEAPSYHLAHRLLGDLGLRVAPVAAQGDAGEGPGAGGEGGGLDGEALRRAVRGERAAGHRPRLLYTVPTFNNPTGGSLPGPARASLVEAAAELGVLVVEDDTYRELAYDGAAPPSLASAAPPGVVLRVGSFAKCVAPGLRLGFLTAEAALVRRLAAGGALDSGGGLNHTSAVAMAHFGTSGAFAEHVAGVRDAYAARRDALVAALQPVAAAHPGLGWRPPAGGWFLWVRLPAGLAGERLLPVAEAAGTAFLPGRRFQAGGTADGHVRLAFSRLPPAELAEGARRLGHALAQARS